ncbi:MAG: hypothetical protein PHP97_01490 [Candidatus Shapirobacteria bacterium]|nr:hypothetical protein [Candidatus Shapirobacteria bacterium]MDD4382931.1 hypothetical protein [Candidatus Shapirobacteria bacterium]
MTIFLNFLTIAMVLMAAIILMWIASLNIICSKKMVIFLPFFVISLSYCINVALNFYGINDQKAWFIPESLLTISALWILIILIKNDV